MDYQGFSAILLVYRVFHEVKSCFSNMDARERFMTNLYILEKGEVTE
jgi:hypothetical protein